MNVTEGARNANKPTNIREVREETLNTIFEKEQEIQVKVMKGKNESLEVQVARTFQEMTKGSIITKKRKIEDT